MRLWAKRHPPEVAEHTTQGSARSKPTPTIDHRSARDGSVDQLAGLLDRTRFEIRLAEEFEKARRLGNDFVLICFDIDEFQSLNDAYGHRTGNEVLVLVARVLRSNAPPMDVVARYGSDEFLVLMPRASLVGARGFFERIREEVAERSMLDLGFTVRLSAGAVKLHHDAGAVPQDLLETADHAMYVAKRQGRDRLFTAVAVGLAENGREEAYPEV